MQYDGNGKVVRTAKGNAIATYDPTDINNVDAFEWNADLVGFGNSSFSQLTATGRIDVTNYYSSSDGTTSPIGQIKSVGYQIGSAGSFIPTESWTYTDGGIASDGVWNVETDTFYPDASNSAVKRTTSYSYDSFWQDSSSSNTSQPKIVTTTIPQVVTGQNGPGTSVTYQTKTYYDSHGNAVWAVDGNGFVTYSEYDSHTGARTKYIEDADPSSITTAAVTGPTRSSSLPTALNLTTIIESDSQGRPTKVTDPNGNTTYTVYDDTTEDDTPRRTLTYTGWNATTKQPTGPVYATIDDPATGIKDTITYSWTGSGGLPVDSNGVPTGAEDFGSGNYHLQSLVREIRNVSGQVVEVREFTDFTGLSYVPDTTTSTWATLGTLGTNYLSTKYKYNASGKLYQTTTPDGTITTNVYDARGLLLSQWKGTNNAGATNTDLVESHLVGTGTGNNMVKVASFTYDDNGNQLTSTSYSGTASYTTTYEYDARDRLTDSRGPDKVATKYVYDNLGEQTQVKQYADADADFVIDSGELISTTDTSYDDQGRVYHSELTANGQTLVTDYWYDKNSNLVKQSTGGQTTSKYAYDGAGRVVKTYVADSSGDSSYTDALNVTGDRVYEQYESTYDANGNVILSANRQRFHDTTSTGELGEEKGSAGKTKARVYYTENFYDAADRLTDSVNLGTAGGIALTNPGFESPALSSGSHAYAPTADGWTFTSNGGTLPATGIASNGSGFSAPTAPDGQQVAFVQGTGTMSQSLTLPAGKYTITFKAAQRTTWGGAQGLDVKVDGTTVSSFSSLSGSFSEYVTAVFIVTGGSHTIVFAGTQSGDNTAFVDSVQIKMTAPPSTAPSRSDTVLVNSYTYDAAGRPFGQTDPKGIVSANFYDLAGRTIKTVANYNASSSTITTTQNQTTAYGYNTAGQLATQTAVLPGSASQVTEYVYGVSSADGSTIASNEMLRTIKYPDLSTGAASSSTSGQESYTYDALGRVLTKTDRNGTVHTYGYDTAGRQTSDTITTLASGVDGTVRRIDTAYDSHGNPYLFTSYAGTATTSTVVNQVQRVYNDLGQVVDEYQATAGSVNTSTTPKVHYTYSNLSKGSRLETVTYPNGRVLTYVYGTSGSSDDKINRLTQIKDGSVILESTPYYLGLSTVVARYHLENSGSIDYFGNASVGEAGDQYAGLDRFGRIVEESSDGLWYAYGYDRNGNRLFKEDLANSSLSELYTYDDLNRLATTQRGTLNSTKTGLTGSASRSQSWSLDALGNSTSVTTDATTNSRTNNQQNQMLVDGNVRYLYDKNGNQIQSSLSADFDHDGDVDFNDFLTFQSYNGQTGKTWEQGDTDGDGDVDFNDYLAFQTQYGSSSPATKFKYDAWNRLVEIEKKSGGTTTTATYGYDALGRRVNDNGTQVYFNTSWQIVEERNASGTPTASYAWSPVYIDAMIARDRDTNADGTLDERLYVSQDANWNVTALIDTSGTVVERFTYDAYGTRQVLSSSWAATSDAYAWRQGFQGGFYDTTLGNLMLFRNRMYDTATMRWMQQDPLGTKYQDGMNLYQMLGNNPSRYNDPLGLDAKTDEDKAAKNGDFTCGQWAFSSGQDPMPSWLSTAINLGLVSPEDAAKGRYLNPDLSVGGEHPIYVAAKMASLGVTYKNPDGSLNIDPAKASGIKPLGSNEDALKKDCPPGHYKVVLYLYPNPRALTQGIDPAKGDLMANDWHWATQHSDGTYSDKSTSRKACACNPKPNPANPFKMKIVGVFCVKGDPRTAPDKLK
ncbi:MAG: RHS repeat-associated core domain-containing protein [Tepidisphaeraceae bacterium]